jgi:hypothetical protein
MTRTRHGMYAGARGKLEVRFGITGTLTAEVAGANAKPTCSGREVGPQALKECP